MNTARLLLAVVGGVSAGYALVALFTLGYMDFGVAAAVSALCVVGVGLLRHVQRGRDKQYHPASQAVHQARGPVMRAR